MTKLLFMIKTSTFAFLFTILLSSIMFGQGNSDKISSGIEGNYLYKKLEQKFNEEEVYKFNELELTDKAQSSTNFSLKKNPESTFLVRNSKSSEDLLDKSPDNVMLIIPTSEETSMELMLMKSNILSDDFGDKNEGSSKQDFGLHYHGVVKSDMKSTVAVSIFEDQISALIRGSNGEYSLKKTPNGSLMLSKLSKEVKNDALIKHQCENEEEHLSSEEDELVDIDKLIKMSSNYKTTSCPPLKVKYVLDQSIINYFGGTSAARNYVTTRFNEVDLIYNDFYYRTGYYHIPLQLVTPHNYGVGSLLSSSELETAKSNSLVFSSYARALEAEFLAGASHWNALHAVVHVPDYFGGGSANTNRSGQTPICNDGPYTKGRGPFASIALHDRTSGPDDYYFTYVMAHELGHNFRISHNNRPGDLMNIVSHELSVNTLYQMYVNRHYCPCHSSNRLESQVSLDENMNIFPNPVNDKLNIYLQNDLLKAREVILEVYNVDGKKVLSAKRSTDKNIEIDVQNLLSSQLYYVTMKTDNGKSITKKFVKE